MLPVKEWGQNEATVGLLFTLVMKRLYVWGSQRREEVDIL